MKKRVLAILLLACGLTVQAASDASGTGSYVTIGSCVCGGDNQTKPATVNFSFNFTLETANPCDPATGTITIADAGCKVHIKGKITKVTSFVVDEISGLGVSTVYGVLTSGKLKGKFFKLEITGGQFLDSHFAFQIVTALCVDDCPGYVTSGFVPPGTIFFGI